MNEELANILKTKFIVDKKIMKKYLDEDEIDCDTILKVLQKETKNTVKKINEITQHSLQQSSS